MTNNKDHGRELERHVINGDVDIYDSLRDLYVGRLVNIHEQGLMIMGEFPLEEDKIYTLDLHVPMPINNQSVIQLGVDCLWTREADLSGKYWMGCAIIDASSQSIETIRLLVASMGDIF